MSYFRRPACDACRDTGWLPFRLTPPGRDRPAPWAGSCQCLAGQRLANVQPAPLEVYENRLRGRQSDDQGRVATQVAHGGRSPASGAGNANAGHWR